MKKGILLILCFVLVFQVYSQDEWFAESSTWTYDLSGWGRPHMLVSVATAEDSIINGKAYRKIQSTEYFYDQSDPTKIKIIEHSIPLLARQDGNKTYYYSYFLQEDKKIFDFDKVVGDTIDFINYSDKSEDYSLVDSIGEIEINNQFLKFQDIRIHYTLGTYEYDYILKIIEKIGPINGLHSGFVPPFIFTSTDPTEYDFRCFRNDNSEYSTGMNMFGLHCDEVPLIANTVGVEGQAFTISPNPFTNIINIENLGNEIESVKILSVEGKELGTYKINNNTNQLNLENIDANYLILIGLDTEKKIKIIRPIVKAKS